MFPDEMTGRQVTRSFPGVPPGTPTLRATLPSRSASVKSGFRIWYSEFKVQDVAGDVLDVVISGIFRNGGIPGANGLGRP